jgi:hypothetical protein
MKDYSKGKIYTIKNKNDNSKIYVGSTIQSLYQRFKGHKCSCNNPKFLNCLLYKEVNNDWSDWYIELYEDYPCNKLNDLLVKESEIIKQIGTLNIITNYEKQFINVKDKIKYYKEKAKEAKKKETPKEKAKEAKEAKKKAKEAKEKEKEEIKAIKKEERKKKIREYQRQYYLEQKK